VYHISNLVLSQTKKAFEQCKTETGIATYDVGIENETWLETVKSERLIDGTELDGTETTVLETTETATTLGTVDGTADHGATTVFDPTQRNDETGIPGAHDAGIATTELQVSGTVIVDGTMTTELTGNETTDDEITETITVEGTLSGTSLHYTTTVLEPTSTTLDGANDATHETGTATTVVHVYGTTTVVGTTTTELDGNETIELVKTETTTLDGTEAGTDDH